MRVQYTATRSRQEHLPNLNSLMGTDVLALAVTDVDFSTCRFKGAINLDKLGMFARLPRREVTRWHLRGGGVAAGSSSG